MDTPRPTRRIRLPIAAAAAALIALSLTGIAAPAQGPQAQAAPPQAAARTVAYCRNCGTVESVRAVRRPGRTSGVGVAAGAVVGGVLGNQIGGGNGRSLATIAGAVGGGYAGNEIEKRSNAVTRYQVRVRMEDGRLRRFSYRALPQFRAGDRVRVAGGRLRRDR